MSPIVEYPLESGGSIYVDVDMLENDIDLAATPGEVVAKVNQTLETALSMVTPMAESAVKKFRGLVDAPDEVCLEFGVSLGYKVAAIVASSSGNSQLKVTMTWKNSHERPL